ncbi:WG repeat-containing protein [Soonwooa purpurea]
MITLKTTLTAILLFGATIFAFSQELTLKKVGNKFGYENSKGKMVIKPVYDHAKEFSDEGWAEVNVGATESEILGLMGGFWGVIDESGKIIVPIEYDGVNYFANDKLFQAVKGNKAYFYNRKGKLVKVKDYTDLKESLFQD